MHDGSTHCSLAGGKRHKCILSIQKRQYSLQLFRFQRCQPHLSHRIAHQLARESWQLPSCTHCSLLYTWPLNDIHATCGYRTLITHLSPTLLPGEGRTKRLPPVVQTVTTRLQSARETSLHLLLQQKQNSRQLWKKVKKLGVAGIESQSIPIPTIQSVNIIALV